MVPHCRPSDQEEVQQFMCLSEDYMQQLYTKEYGDIDTYEYYNYK